MLSWVRVFAKFGLLVLVYTLTPLALVAQIAPPCDHPLTFSIGSIDTRYQINRDRIIEIINEVDQLWQQALDKDVVAYEENGEIPIHFIYTRNQRSSRMREHISNSIEHKKELINTLETRYDSLEQVYKNWLYKYEDMHNELQRMVNEYNETVQFINTGGGATNNEEMKNLKTLKANIEQKRDVVESFGLRLDSMRYQVNDLGNEINWLATDTNVEVNRYNQVYGSTKTFFQGKYIYNDDERKIEIYQFSDLNDLRLVLAHEIGHALGLNHVSTSNSIMYYLRYEQNPKGLKLSREDIQALQEQCSR